MIRYDKQSCKDGKRFDMPDNELGRELSKYRFTRALVESLKTDMLKV